MQMNQQEFLARLEETLTNLNKDLSSLSPDEQYRILTERAIHVIKPELLLKRLQKAKKDRKPLRVKYGIDPTGKDLHLGHIVPIIVARRLQQMGHKVFLLFGDFTAYIGDPTGRVKTRPILTEEEIKANVAEYKDQVRRFIDLDKVEIVYNSTFYDQMSIKDLMTIYRSNRLSPLLQREDFRNRIDGLTIGEALYPTLMAIDSVFMRPHIELGGNDQFLNFEITNEVMDSRGLPPECAITTELLMGTSGDGSKMSKSKGNFISLRDPAEEVFGKVMSIPDSLLEHYFKLLTDISDAEWETISNWMSDGSLNPMDVKKLMGRILVTLLHSKESATRAQKQFEKVFSSGKLPEDMPSHQLKTPSGDQPWVDLLMAVDFVRSRREAKEFITSGALRVQEENGEWTQITEFTASLPDRTKFVIKLGKRKFAQITLK